MAFNGMVKKYRERVAKVEKMFEDVGNSVAQDFVANSKRLTTTKKVVKTGTYRRSWNSEVEKKGTDTMVKCMNSVDYASHLEYGHRIVTRRGKDTGKKTQGLFIGLDSVKKTRKAGVSRIKKYMRSIMQ